MSTFSLSRLALFSHSLWAHFLEYGMDMATHRCFSNAHVCSTQTESFPVASDFPMVRINHPTQTIPPVFIVLALMSHWWVIFRSTSSLPFIRNILHTSVQIVIFLLCNELQYIMPKATWGLMKHNPLVLVRTGKHLIGEPPTLHRRHGNKNSNFLRVLLQFHLICQCFRSYCLIEWLANCCKHFLHVKFFPPQATGSEMFWYSSRGVVLTLESFCKQKKAFGGCVFWKICRSHLTSGSRLGYSIPVC